MISPRVCEESVCVCAYVPHAWCLALNAVPSLYNSRHKQFRCLNLFKPLRLTPISEYAFFSLFHWFRFSLSHIFPLLGNNIFLIFFYSFDIRFQLFPLAGNRSSPIRYLSFFLGHINLQSLPPAANCFSSIRYPSFLTTFSLQPLPPAANCSSHIR